MRIVVMLTSSCFRREFVAAWLVAAVFSPPAPAQQVTGEPLPPDYVHELARRDAHPGNAVIDSRVWDEYFGAEGHAKGVGADDVDTEIHVTVRLKDERYAGEFSSFLSGIGGRAEAASGAWVFAVLRRSAILQLDRGPGVFSVGPESAIRPLQQAGRGAMAVALTELIPPFAGPLRRARPVTVGILDCGFEGADALPIARRIRAQQKFHRHPQSAGCAGEPRHGTQVLQIIAAIAPMAEFDIAEFDGTDSMFAAAAQWLVAAAAGKPAVSIINYSGGKHDGPHDGSDVLDDIVRREAANKGILWVNSAGNEGDKHVLLTAADFRIGENGFLELIHAPDPRGIRVTPISNGPMDVFIAWTPSPKPGATGEGSIAQDLDAILFREDVVAPGSKGPLRTAQLCINSRTEKCVWPFANRQTGTQPAVESQLGIPVTSEHTYLLRLRAVNVPRPDLLKIHIFFMGLDGGRVEGATPEESLAIPAEGGDTVAVAAVDRAGRLRSYSSVGGRAGNRGRPDRLLAAVDGIEVQPDGPPFRGTSASAAVGTGLAAAILGVCRAELGPTFRDLRGALLRTSEGPNHVLRVNSLSAEHPAAVCGGSRKAVETTSTRPVSKTVISATRIRALVDAVGTTAAATPIVKFNVGRPEPPIYRIGEAMTIAIQTERKVYYSLLNIDPTGASFAIAPLGRDPLIWQGTEAPEAIPADDQQRIVIDGPAGTATLVLIVSDMPIAQIWAREDFGELAGHVFVAELGYIVRGGEKITEPSGIGRSRH